MAWPLIWYYLIPLYMFIWVVTGQGHSALCCRWVRVRFITSIPVNLYIRPCSFETFYRTAGPSRKAWYWNHGLRWQTSLVCSSCDKWHAVYSIRDCRNVCCAAVLFFRTCCFEVLYSHNCGTSSIFVSQMAVGFWHSIRTEVSLGFFVIKTRNPLFHPFVQNTEYRNFIVYE